MSQERVIAERLRAALPTEHHPTIGRLARIITKIVALAPAAPERPWDLSSPAAKALLQELPEHPASAQDNALCLSLDGGRMGTLKIRREGRGKAGLLITWIPEAPEVPALRWAAIEDAVASCSARLTVGTHRKYDRSLYIARLAAGEAIERFLQGDVRCLVIAGESGVGKTNLLLAQSESMKGDPRRALLVYNGPRMQLTQSLELQIMSDLAQHLDADAAMIQRPELLWQTIDSLCRNEQRMLLVAIDAINEHDDALSLLAAIDRDLVARGPSWLKVIVTTRPQPWHQLRRQLFLPQQQYVVCDLQPFDETEFQLAFRNYRTSFNLQTTYEQLHWQARKALSDPLLLLLVAEVYQNSRLPRHIQPEQIYQRYIDNLVATRRLEWKDVRFLEHTLMPLLISPDSYRPQIGPEQIDQASDTDEGPLFPLIYDIHKGDGGEPSNASLLRLADTPLLARYEAEAGVSIGFVYERFFDYFGGRQVQALVRAKHVSGQDLADTYGEYLAVVGISLFMWGPVKHALAAQLREEGGQALISALCTQQTTLSKPMLVQILTEWGKDDPAQSLIPLAELLWQDPPAPTWGDLIGQALKRPIANLTKQLVDAEQPLPLLSRTRALREWLHERSNALGERPPFATTLLKVAGETARNLIAIDQEHGRHTGERTASDDLYMLLGLGASHPSRSVRRHAAQYISYVWDDNAEAGLALLQQVVGRLRPLSHLVDLPTTIYTLDTAVRVSAYIFFKNYRFTGQSEQLQQVAKLREIWQPVLKYLVVRGRRAGRLLAPLAQRVLINGLTNRVLEMMTSLPYKSTVHPTELREFFHLPDEQKNRVRAIVSMIDPAPQVTLSNMRPTLEQAAADGDPMTSFLVEQALLVQQFVRNEDVLDTVRRLFNIGMACCVDEAPNVFAGAMQHAAYVLAEHLDDDGRALRYLTAMVTEYYEQTRSLQLRGHFGKAVANNLAGLARLHYTRYHNLDLDIFEVVRRKASTDVDLQVNTLYDVATLVSNSDPEVCRLGLLLLREFDYFTEPRAQDEIDNLLRKVGVRYPSELDRFLSDSSINDRFKKDGYRQRLEADEVRESDAEAVIAFSLPLEFEALRIETIRQAFLWATDRALESDDFSAWTSEIAQGIVNMLYGEVVYELPGFRGMDLFRDKRSNDKKE